MSPTMIPLESPPTKTMIIQGKSNGKHSDKEICSGPSSLVALTERGTSQPNATAPAIQPGCRTPKALLLRAVRKVLRPSRFSKLVSRAAYDPPLVSYRFEANDIGCYSILVEKHPELNDLLAINGYYAKADFVHTEDGNRIAYAFIGPTGKRLRDCDHILLYSHGSSADLGKSVDLGYRIINTLCDKPNSTALDGSRISTETTTHRGSTVIPGIVIWDYPGYGLSTGGSPNEENINEGIVKVYDRVRNFHGVPADRIVAVGQSIGSVPTTFLASLWKSHTLAKVILISPFASAYHVFTHIDPIGVQKENKDPVGALSNVNLLDENGCPWPVFIIHGDQDTFVPIEHAQAIIASLQKVPEDHEDIVDAARECARRELQNRLYSSKTGSHFISPDSSGAGPCSEACLWPSAQSGANQGSTMHSIDAVEPMETDDDTLYLERMALLTIPGAGHNDVMKSSMAFNGLKEVIVSSQPYHRL